jgi:hypothetical protein
MTRGCCVGCDMYQGGHRPVGNCTHYGYLVVSQYDGPRCFFRSDSGSTQIANHDGAARVPARSEARTDTPPAPAIFSFFDNKPQPGIFHQRRCSTADESGLPENANSTPWQLTR